MKSILIMNARVIGLLAAVSGVVAAITCGGAPSTQSAPGPEPAQPADTIYVGGDIVTVNDAQPTAEALAVKDGKIVAVGKADGRRIGP